MESPPLKPAGRRRSIESVISGGFGKQDSREPLRRRGLPAADGRGRRRAVHSGGGWGASLQRAKRRRVPVTARAIYDRQAKERQKAGGEAGREKQLGGVPENLPEAHADARDQAGKAVGFSCDYSPCFRRCAAISPITPSPDQRRREVGSGTELTFIAKT